MMKFILNKSTKATIITLVAFVILVVIVARQYYSNQNKAVDPRVITARQLYAGYDRLASDAAYSEIFLLLDSIENIYNAVPHYRKSFELGVIANNRAAACLTIALFRDSLNVQLPFDNISTDSVFTLAEIELTRAIDIYTHWMETYSKLSEDKILHAIQPEFIRGLESYPKPQVDEFLQKRATEIRQSTYETERRLSVAYTNLGVIYRYNEQFEQAVELYQKALGLWDRNLTAENNLNKLLGRPEKKRNFIQRMFPPEKEK